METTSIMNSTTNILKNLNLTDCSKNFPFNTRFHFACLGLVLLIIAVNAIVLYLFHIDKTLRKQLVNFGLLSLAVADLAAGITLLLHIAPFFYIYFIGCLSGTSLRVLQDAAYVTSKVTLLSCIGHLLLLSTDRMIAVSYALRYHALVTRQRMYKSIMAIWFLVIALVLLELLLYVLQGYSTTSLSYKIYVVMLATLFLLLPFVVLMVQYTIMIILVGKLVRSCQTESTTKKALKNLKVILLYAVMFMCFLCSCLPLFVVRLLVVVDVRMFKTISQSSLNTIVMMRYCSSLVNPMLYTYFKPDFRQAVKHTFIPKRFGRREEQEIQFMNRERCGTQDSHLALGTNC